MMMHSRPDQTMDQTRAEPTPGGRRETGANRSGRKGKGKGRETKKGTGAGKSMLYERCMKAAGSSSGNLGPFPADA